MKQNNSSGNALWIILIAIALLAALTLAITRSSDKTEQTGDVERYRIHASEIMRFSKGVEQALGQMRMRGLAENDISFDGAGLPAVYTNPNCADASCRVFDKAGGGVAYRKPGNKYNDGTDWIITGSNDVVGVGSADADLIMILPNIDEGVCLQINRMLSVTPGGPDNDIEFTPYTGSFVAAKDIAGMNGAKAGCADNDGATYNFFYYQILLTR